MCAGGGELAVALLEYGFVPAFEAILWGDVADGAVQSNGVVMFDISRRDASSIVHGKRSLRTEALALEGFVPAFDLAVGLGIVGCGLHVSHAADADELFEVAGNKLRAVVGDDAWCHAWIFFPSPLQDGFDLDFLHGFADLPVDDETAATIEHAAQKVKGAGDVEVTDIDVPVFVRLEWLHEASAFPGRRTRSRSQDAGLLENAVNAGRTARDKVPIEEHEGKSAITFERKLGMEVEDFFLLVGFEPMVAWDPGVVFVDFAIALLPVVEFTFGDVDPGDEAFGRDLGFVGPGLDEIDDLVAGVVGSPLAVQSSPSSFFKTVWASMSSAMTSFLR